jgi:cytoplasmic iron level regulating protein YaaA (DUF328/UPF0246 family)
MLILLSPAKTLNYESKIPKIPTSLPIFKGQTLELVEELRKFTPSKLSELMDISDKLAALNVARFASWREYYPHDNSRPAIFAFKGDVYEGLDAYSLSAKQLEYANSNIRILSGLYGILLPFNLMQPYRLEMGTSLRVKKSANLYDYWRDSITGELSTELFLRKNKYLINLASEEYFKVVNTRLFPHEIISPVFLDEKNGKYKIISFYAKKARGLMARYCIDNKISNPDQLVNFDYEGYAYSEEESEPNRPVFKRASKE